MINDCILLNKTLCSLKHKDEIDSEHTILTDKDGINVNCEIEDERYKWKKIVHLKKIRSISPNELSIYQPIDFANLPHYYKNSYLIYKCITVACSLKFENVELNGSFSITVLIFQKMFKISYIQNYNYLK